MNERIKKLAEQAGLEFDDDEALEFGEEIYYVTKKYMGKFVELIVKECVQTLSDNTPERFTNESAEEDWDKGYDRAMKDCVHHIKEHFGVSDD